ncbi:MAG: riboflavin synthase [Saprospiraceae bacterium]|nr:riboflavin synthase [Saprospiraceae bacterium]
MFTGIVECCGQIQDLTKKETNLTFTIESEISSQLKIDQSLSHDGVCLTVVDISGNLHRVVAVQETLDRSTLGNWQKGQMVNLERAMVFGARLDGHIVQGHVDAKGRCFKIEDLKGSHLLSFSFDIKNAPLMVQKGSIAINGVSLTVIDPTDTQFKVAIIPYTWDHTNFGQLKAGMEVNLEFDIMGKYFARMMDAYVPK